MRTTRAAFAVGIGVLCVLAFGPLAGGAAAAERESAGRRASQETPADAAVHEALQDASRSYSEGNLDKAWNAYVRFLVEAKSSTGFDEVRDVSYLGFGRLGNLVGGRLPDKGRVVSFCERAAHPNALGECERWLEEQLALLDADPDLQRLVPEELPIALYPSAMPLGGRPIAEVVWNGRVAKALVDTGAPWTELESQESDRPEPLMSRLRPGIRGTLAERTLIEVSDLRFGASLLRGVRVYWRESQGDVTSNLGGVLGMDLLLRFPSVCFGWRERVLHLGSLGPCADGAVARPAKLLPWAKMIVTLNAADGTQVPGLIDTGSGATFCSNRIRDSQGEKAELAIAGAAHASVICTFDSTIRTGSSVGVGHEVIIGTDTLMASRAFGWKLNPLRVYLLPAGRAGGD